MMAKYSTWIYTAIAVMLATSSVWYYGTTEWSAKRVLIKGCDYLEGKGMEQWCQEPMINQLRVIKCDSQLYVIYTDNNQCADLIVTGGGGKRYYTKFAYTWAKETQDKCGYIYRGGCND